MNNQIAIVGFACRYPDANTPEQLWENILSRRRAFRIMPSERLNASYFNPDKTATDYIYSNKVAVLKNYQFERSKFKIANSNYLSADLTHWIALEVVDEVLKNSKLHELSKKDREKTGVIIGNTLTGEFSRANLLRLRWPYVCETLLDTLKQESWGNREIDKLLGLFEKNYKRSFPAMEEDSLAGGLSNTIAGRICNYFDFKGGGFTIDGACSSSLLALSKACDSIANENLSIAIVGGVDLSLDPFELVGFSRAGALATKEMLVYDENSNGFFPGEGCGFIVLTNYEYAQQNDLNILGVIKGWGISSDGKGGLTRPSVEGQMLAIERAYERAGYGLETVSYIEGHGTGTKVGDEVELKAIINILNKNGKHSQAYISSVKANIGHTKAAAGIAGIIKGLLVINKRVIPPISGNSSPHPILNTSIKLKLNQEPIIFNKAEPLRIGVSSMGFGGINVHVTIEEDKHLKKEAYSINEQILKSSYQDSELFLIAAQSKDALIKKLNALFNKVKILSIAELSDLSCSMYEKIDEGDIRVAIVADSPENLFLKLKKIIAVLKLKYIPLVDNNEGIYFSDKKKRLRIGLLFAGQGNEVMKANGLLVNRFPFITDLIPDILKSNILNENDLTQPHISQPAIVSSSITAIKMLRKFGLTICATIGHSLGEFSSLYWSGILSEKDTIALVKARGLLMHNSTGVKGKMLALSFTDSGEIVENILEKFDVSLACINSTNQVVFSGTESSINSLQRYCKENKMPSSLLKVQNAFHSNLMKGLEDKFVEEIKSFDFLAPFGNVYSTVTGSLVTGKEEVLSNLKSQLTQPVLFYKAFQAASKDIDVWIDTGCQPTLQKLVGSFSEIPVLPLELSGNTVVGILKLAGLMFVNGEDFNFEILFNNRFYRKLHFNEEIKFISNPCEAFFNSEAMQNNLSKKQNLLEGTEVDLNNKRTAVAKRESGLNIEIVIKSILSDRLKLPIEDITDESRMLDDFHLNSLYVGQLISDIANQHNLNLTDIPTEYSNASVKEIIEMFVVLNEEILDGSSTPKNKSLDFEGISTWLYPFEVSVKEVGLLVGKSEEQTACSNFFLLGDLPLSLLPFVKSCNPQTNDGLIIFLLNYDPEEIIKALVNCLEFIKENFKIQNIVFIQSDEVVNGFAKSLFLEHPNLNVKVITINSEWLSESLLNNEITDLHGFAEIVYIDKKRYVPYLKPIIDSGFEVPIIPSFDDVILVTGGAKGITFECVRSLGAESKCSFILIGRSDPQKDALLSRNLYQLKEAGIRFKYYQSDIGDFDECSSLFSQLLNNEMITGVIHAAGINRPQKVYDLTINDFENNLKPKFYGLRNLISCINTTPLKFFITFGSIIAESGMNGNADYSLSNQWLKNEVSFLATQYPNIYFLNLEWSVWGGTGMGHDLGVLDTLKRKGVNPITLDEGINFFLNLLKRPIKKHNLVISGRHGAVKTLYKQEAAITQSYRFIEEILIYYKDVEIITQYTLSENTDLYLSDHVIDGQIVFPAVFGLEAIAQALKMLATNFSGQIQFSNVNFSRPIILRKNQSKKLRVVIQRRNYNTFAAVIRDEETSFKIDHFSANIIIGDNSVENKTTGILMGGNEKTKLDTENDYYNSLLFHKGIFKRIYSFEYIGAYNCIAKASLVQDQKYFSDFLSENLVLSDPSLNDAVLHAIQVCVPHQTLLPKRIEKILFYPFDGDVNAVIIIAKEIKQIVDEYYYDIEVLTENNILVAQWIGVKFQVLHQKKKRKLTNELLENVLRRKLDLIIGLRSNYKITSNKKKSDGDVQFHKRSDGKPISLTANYQTRSHSLNQTIELEADVNIACDVEAIIYKHENDWGILLGDNRFQLIKEIQEFIKEDISISATRIWCAIECIRKAGLQLLSPLLVTHSDNDGTIYFKIDNYIILTYLCIWTNTGKETIFAILIERDYEKI